METGVGGGKGTLGGVRPSVSLSSLSRWAAQEGDLGGEKAWATASRQAMAPPCLLPQRAADLLVASEESILTFHACPSLFCLPHCFLPSLCMPSCLAMCSFLASKHKWANINFKSKKKSSSKRTLLAQSLAPTSTPACSMEKQHASCLPLLITGGWPSNLYGTFLSSEKKNRKTWQMGRTRVKEESLNKNSYKEKLAGAMPVGLIG